MNKIDRPSQRYRNLEDLRKFVFSAATLIQEANGEYSDDVLDSIEDDCRRAATICITVLADRKMACEDKEKEGHARV